MPRGVKKPVRVLTEPQKEVRTQIQLWVAKQHLKAGHYLRELNILIAENFDEGGGIILVLKVLLTSSLEFFYANHPHKIKEWNRKMGIRNKHTGPKKWSEVTLAIRKAKQDAKEQRRQQKRDFLS